MKKGLIVSTEQSLRRSSFLVSPCYLSQLSLSKTGFVSPNTVGEMAIPAGNCTGSLSSSAHNDLCGHAVSHFQIPRAETLIGPAWVRRET